jgi:hypothetical protein
MKRINDEGHNDSFLHTFDLRVWSSGRYRMSHSAYTGDVGSNVTGDGFSGSRAEVSKGD